MQTYDSEGMPSITNVPTNPKITHHLSLNEDMPAKKLKTGTSNIFTRFLGAAGYSRLSQPALAC